MKKFILLTTAIALSLSAFAQKPGIPNLSDEQKASIKQLRIAMGKEIKKANNLLREKKARLITLQDEDKPDQKAIHKTIDEISGLRGQIMKARADFRIKVNAQLNDEQRTAFQQHNNRLRHNGREMRAQKMIKSKKVMGGAKTKRLRD